MPNDVRNLKLLKATKEMKDMLNSALPILQSSA